MQSLSWGFGLSIDSFMACLIIGFHKFSWRKKLTLSLSFGVCDAAGSFWASLHPLPQPGLLIWTSYVFVAYLLAVTARENRALLYYLPIFLSIDNMLNASSTPALALGIGSSGMALLGFTMAAALQQALFKGEACA